MKRDGMFGIRYGLGMFAIVAMCGGYVARSQEAAQNLNSLVGQVMIEKVTGYAIDPAIPAIDFTVELSNNLGQPALLREIRVTGVRLHRRDDAPITVGTGSGTTVGRIRTVPGFPAVDGIELPPGQSAHRFRIALPADAAAMGANLIAIFNALNAGEGRRDVSMLFTLDARGGIRDPHGIEWIGIEQNKRFTANFDNLISFESRGTAGDISFQPAGTIRIQQLGSACVATEDNRRFFDMRIAINNQANRPLVLREPSFSQTAFYLGDDQRVLIGLGNGETSQTVEHTPGFPAENGMLLSPGLSTHLVRFPMAADDGESLRNLVALMNVMGSPEQRQKAALIFALKARAGVQTPTGLEGVEEIEAHKNFPTIIRGEYLFQ